MQKRFCFLLTLVLLVSGWTAAWGQQAQSDVELTPRDMFRKAAGRLVPAPANPKPPEAPRRTPAEQETEPASPPSREPVDNSVAKSETPRRPVDRPSDPPVDRPAEATLVSTREPLGLRYSILKEVPGGGAEEVPTDTVFRSGDRIRLTIAVTETAYVYVVTKGSSGKWQVLFPTPGVAGGSNLIPGGVIYPVPAGHWFAFDEQVGEESLFVMVSRTPEKDLDSLIYKLKDSGTEPSPSEPVLMASNIPPVDDTVISQLRDEVYARDLVFEKVDETSASDDTGQWARPEKAVYVVNKTGANNSRVVADIKLQHR